MIRTLIISLAALIGLVWLTWSAQERLSALRLFEDASAVATTDATVTEVVRGAGSDENSPWVRIEIAYEVGGKEFGRTVVNDLGDFAPKQDQQLTITYVKRDPATALFDYELEDLPKQIEGMQYLVLGLGLAAIIIPFTIAGFGRRKQKKNAG